MYTLPLNNIWNIVAAVVFSHRKPKVSYVEGYYKHHYYRR